MFILLSLIACDRPFVAPKTPNIQIVSPNLEEVFLQDEITLTLKATSFRDVDKVFLNQTLLSQTSNTNQWTATVPLNMGTNTLIFSAFDIEGVEQRDTLYAIRMNPEIDTQAPTLLEPRGGHTATFLPQQNTLLLLGGASSTQTPASNHTALYALNQARFSPAEESMRTARMGHTATLLPDNRVLIIGGSTIHAPSSITEMVETVELYDQGVFKEIPVLSDDPIRRTYHTTFIYPDVENNHAFYLYLYGGIGDVRYGNDPFIATRRDMRIFHFIDDTLVPVSPTIGILFDYIAGHTQTLFEQSGNQQFAKYLISGIYQNGNQEVEQRFFTLNVNPSRLEETQFFAFFTPRYHHASSLWGQDLIVLSGGLSAYQTALSTLEIFSPTAQKVYKFPSGISLDKNRWAHTATNLGNARILLTGGFDENGLATATTTWLTLW